MKICIRTYTYVCILWIVPHFPPSCQSFKLIVSIDLSHWLIHTPIGRLAICNFTFVRVAASWVLSNLQHTYIYIHIYLPTFHTWCCLNILEGLVGGINHERASILILDEHSLEDPNYPPQKKHEYLMSRVQMNQRGWNWICFSLSSYASFKKIHVNV